MHRLFRTFQQAGFEHSEAKQNLGANKWTRQKKRGKGDDFVRREERCQTVQVIPFLKYAEAD